jgi:hypothetical protein
MFFLFFLQSKNTNTYKPITTMGFSELTKSLVVGSSNGSLKFYDAKTLTQSYSYDLPLRSVKISPHTNNMFLALE